LAAEKSGIFEKGTEIPTTGP